MVRVPYGDALDCEARFDRAYDDQTASSVVVFRGGRQTLACSFDRGVCVALVRAVLELR